jgi:hypothetical protein
MNTSTRPDSSSRSRVAGGLTTTSLACFSAAAITGSMKVPACTATCTPGLSMSAQRRTARLLLAW